MPLYEYRCPDCGHEFEEIQKVSAPAITDCPSCGGGEVAKQIGLSSFSLKGSGWYSDHYGLKGSSAPSGDSGGGGDAPASAPSPAPAPSPSPSPSPSPKSSDSGGT